MKNRLLQIILSCSVLGLALHAWRADAVIIGRETPDKLDLSFSPVDSYPPGNSPNSDGPLVTLFGGQYWQVYAQSRIAPTGPAAGASRLFVRQVAPGQDALPSAVFSLVRFNFSPGQISYVSNSQGGNFNTVTCPFGSPNCVYYQLQQVPSPTLFNYELQGFFQSPESPKPVPEASTGVGALAALGLMGFLRFKKRFA